MTPRPRLWAFAAAAIAVAMVGASYAAAPLYSMFCRVTGYGGTTQTATAKPSKVLDRQIEIRFDANVAPGLALEFAPDERVRTIRIGETALAFFKVRNVGTAPVEAVATYNVAPHKTGKYFQKLECFCFKPRAFAPGEEMELPVVFFVDPRLAEDWETEEVQQITLSYTYFAQPKKEAKAGQPGRDVASPRLGGPGDAG